MLTWYRTNGNTFYLTLKQIMERNVRVKENLHLYTREQYDTMRTFLNKTFSAGFAVTSDRELVSVFNTSGQRGLGDDLVRTAIIERANHLNCFDGFLVKWYQRFGFTEYKREKNWNGPGHPDVVYMRLPSYRV